MARFEEVTVSLVDDFDGTEAAETIRFSFDGRTTRSICQKRTPMNFEGR